MTDAEALPPASILVVDDEESAIRSVRRTLRTHGFEHVLTCDDPREVSSTLEKHRVSLLLLDLLMPHLSGEEVLGEVARSHPDLPVIVVTAEQDVRTAVRCMKQGAVDYLLKPVTSEQLAETVERALEQSALRWENARLREQFFGERLEHAECFEGILTRDPGMLRMFGYLEAISRGTQPVLITGETGTGKELVARALHAVSAREGNFVAVNGAGLDDTMFSDTLFGHTTGAFTGATGDRVGRLEAADSGTLFLDEIGNLPLHLQSKLLSVLEQKKVFPVGSTRSVDIDVRVVAATNMPRDRLMDESHFRQDLLFRLNTVEIFLPPLRERREDIPPLVDYYLNLYCRKYGKRPRKISQSAMRALTGYDWPGNIRALRHALERGVILAEGDTLEAGDFQLQAESGVSGRNTMTPEPAADEAGVNLNLEALERKAIQQALTQNRYNISHAAKDLGVTRAALYRRMEKHGL